MQDLEALAQGQLDEMHQHVPKDLAAGLGTSQALFLEKDGSWDRCVTVFYREDPNGGANLSVQYLTQLSHEVEKRLVILEQVRDNLPEHPDTTFIPPLDRTIPPTMATSSTDVNIQRGRRGLFLNVTAKGNSSDWAFDMPDMAGRRGHHYSTVLIDVGRDISPQEKEFGMRALRWSEKFVNASDPDNPENVGKFEVVYPAPFAEMEAGARKAFWNLGEDERALISALSEDIGAFTLPTPILTILAKLKESGREVPFYPPNPEQEDDVPGLSGTIDFSDPPPPITG